MYDNASSRSIVIHDHNLCSEELLAMVSNTSSSSLVVDTQKFVYSEHNSFINVLTVLLVVSEMTYTVLSGTLNSSIPYHTIPDCTAELFQHRCLTLSASLSCRITALHLFRFSSFTVAPISLGSKNDKFRARANFRGDFSVIFFTIATKKSLHSSLNCITCLSFSMTF